MYEYDVNVVRVVDGDTILAEVNLGFHVWLHGIRFRLARVNAPEMPTLEGVAAREHLAALLVAPVVVASKKIDEYGRWLAEIWAGPDRVNVNDAMLAAGHAVPWPAPKPPPAP